MPIPKHDEIYNDVLNYLSDGKIHSKQELKDYIKKVYNLTDEEMSQRIPSGKTTYVGNRVGWCKTYLKKAGLVDNPKKNEYVITAEGLKALKDKPTGMNTEYLMKYPSFQDFVKGSKDKNSITTTDNNPTLDTPQEVIENAMSQINDQLADDLMTSIMQQTPSFFERLVVDLLQNMGYGGKIEDSAVVTKASGDEGIDGIIREDALGFDKIYIQAKRWNADHVVGTPDINQFAGALMGKGANKGLFITTSRFSKAAIDFVEKTMTARIVLVDGKELTRLMIKYGLGVSTEEVYEIKRIDSDYFAGEDD